MREALKKLEACKKGTGAVTQTGNADNFGGHWQYLRDDSGHE
jgi:hypothetical protein